MRSTTLARRYAGALFGEAQRGNATDAVESDLGLLAHSLQTIPTLRHTLTHPLIAPKRKKEIATEIFKDSIQTITLQFVSLLIDKRREDVLEDIETEFVRLANEARSIQPVTVTSAVELNADEQKALVAKLNEFTGKKVQLQMNHDASLIGGLIIKIEDTIMDGSVRGHLAALRNRMLERS